MGQLCGCHKAPPKRARRPSKGRAVSQDHLFALPKRNGYLRRPIARLSTSFSKDAFLLQSSLDPLMTPSFSSPCSSPAYLPAARFGEPPPLPPRNAGMNGQSQATLQSAMTLDDSRTTLLHDTSCSSNGAYATLSFSCDSDPSTPVNTIRQKPPPKPPRMRHFNDSQISVPENGTLSTPIKRSVASLAEVTNSFDTITMVTQSLDNSLSVRTIEESPPISKSPRLPRPVQSAARDKVYSVLAQTKEFLSHEIEPEYVLEYLRRKGVITTKMDAEIRRCRTRHGMSEYLLDIITSKGQEEFSVFCDALRSMGKQGYVADFLLVLDSLVQLVTSNSRNTMRFIRHTAFNGDGSNGRSTDCPMCNSSEEELFVDDLFTEGPSFDIDISYMDVDTGQTKSFREVQGVKRLRRPHSISGDRVCIREEADRYLPVISVSLYNQCLCNNRIQTLAGLLENYSCVKELSIAKNHIGTPGVVRLGQALEKNRGLVKLDIRLNTIGDEGARHLARGLRRHLSLLSLNVTSTGLTGSGCSILMQGLGRNQSLLQLDIGFNEIDEEGCKAIAEALASNCTLRKLRMRNNGVRSYGATCIFRSLRKNSRLTLLDISSNLITSESVLILGDVLRFNRTLSELNLEKCNISSEGCAALSRSLKTNTTLKVLDLSLNPIGDAGVEALADGLKYNQVMDVLSLNMCDIGNHGFLSLLEAMRFNSAMTSVKLCYNNIGVVGKEDEDGTVEELYEKLCQVLQFNKDLKVLLWGNKFDEATQEAPLADGIDLSQFDHLVPKHDSPRSSPLPDLGGSNSASNRRQSTF